MLTVRRPDFFIAVHFLLLMLAGTLVLGQREIRIAENLYREGRFCEAIPHFSKHLNAYVDKNALVKRGWSYYNCNQLDEAIQDFDDARVLNYSGSELFYYLAKTYQHKHEFEQAIKYFKQYLSANLSDDYLRQRITGEIKRCAHGIELQYRKSRVSVEPLGPGVNTRENEINMMQSPLDPNRFYFSRSDKNDSGKYSILAYTIREADWLKADFLNPNHSFYNEVLAGIKSDGQQLYFSRYDEKTESNKLLIDQFQPGDEPFSNIRFFEGPVNYAKGDRDFFFVNDSTFLFSTDRLPGYGGFDLFITGFSGDYWFKPINLGQAINSKYDEITPSMNPGSNVLFFSSNNQQSIGGYDVFHSSFDTSRLEWTLPKNVGIPVNSAGDDFNFKTTYDGKKALLTSNRKNSSFGGYDILQIIFPDAYYFKSGANMADYLSSRDLISDYRKYGIQKKPLEGMLDDQTEMEITGKRDQNDKFEEELIRISEESTSAGDTSFSEKNNTEYLLIKSMYYHPDKAILDQKENKDFIRSIIETLFEFPGLSVKMTGYCSPGKSGWEDLNKSIEVLLPIVKLMADEGVAPDHIFVAGAGSTLPVARTNVSERLVNASMRYNNRIGFRFNGRDSERIRYEQPFVVQHLKDDSWFLYNSIEKGLAYKVDVAISNEQEFEQVQQYLPFCLAEMDIFTTKKQYYFGIFTQFEKASKAANKIFIETGLNTRVVPFVKEVAVTRENILEFAKTYTDLVNYMEASK